MLPKTDNDKKRFIKLHPTFVQPRGHAVAQIVEALNYKAEGRGFDSR
jgi:hypothetical protein